MNSHILRKLLICTMLVLVLFGNFVNSSKVKADTAGNVFLKFSGQIWLPSYQGDSSPNKLDVKVETLSTHTELPLDPLNEYDLCLFGNCEAKSVNAKYKDYLANPSWLYNFSFTVKADRSALKDGETLIVTFWPTVTVKVKGKAFNGSPTTVAEFSKLVVARPQFPQGFINSGSVYSIELGSIDNRLSAEQLWQLAGMDDNLNTTIDDEAERAKLLLNLTYPHESYRPPAGTSYEWRETGLKDPQKYRDFKQFASGEAAQFWNSLISNATSLTPEFSENDLKNTVPKEQGRNWLITILLGVEAVVASFLAMLISIALWMIRYMLSQAEAVNNPVITDLWISMRDLLNIVFIVALLVMALSNILGIQKDNYGIKKNLPKLIFAVIAVNFSKLFVGLVLDFANILEAAVYSFGGMGPHGTGLPGTQCINLGGWSDHTLTFDTGIEDASLLCRLMRIFRVYDASNVGPAIQGGMAVGGGDLLLAGFVMILILAGSFFGFLAIAIVFLARAIALWFLTITSPIFVIGQAFEPLKSYADKWKENFFKYAFMHVKLAFFLTLGIRLIDAFAQQNQAQTGPGNSYYSVSGNTPLINSSVSLGTGTSIQLNEWMMMIFMFAMIWMGVFASMKSDIGAVDGIADKVTGVGKKAPGFISQYIGIPGVYNAKKAGMTLKKIWHERHKNVEEADELAASKMAVRMTKLANKAMTGTLDLPVVRRWPGKWFREDFFGLNKGTPALMDRSLKNEMKEASVKRTGRMDTPMAMELLEEAAHSKNSGDFLNAAETLIDNQDNHNDVIAHTMHRLADGTISKEDAIQIAEKGKAFHVGFLAIEDFIMSMTDTKKLSGKIKTKELEVFLKSNGKEEDFAKIIKRGDIIMPDKSRVKLADLNLVSKEQAKKDLKQIDPENSNLSIKSSKVQIDTATSRGNDGKLEISEDRLIRDLLNIADRAEMTNADATTLHVQDLSAQKTAAEEQLERWIRRLKKNEVETILQDLQKSPEKLANYTGELNPSETGDTGKLIDRINYIIKLGDTKRVWETDIHDEYKTKTTPPPISPGGAHSGGGGHP